MVCVTADNHISVYLVTFIHLYVCVMDLHHSVAPAALLACMRRNPPLYVCMHGLRPS
jgi:hypothetical protein